MHAYIITLPHVPTLHPRAEKKLKINPYGQQFNFITAEGTGQFNLPTATT